MLLKKDELDKLQRMQGPVMISIIMPMSKRFADIDGNASHLKNMIRETEQQLRDNYDPVRVEGLMQKVKSLEGGIDFENVSEGIVLLVSDELQRVVPLPFTPKEKIVIGNTFQTRDLLLACCKYPTYVLLSLSAGYVRLFRGTKDVLAEIKTVFFPARYEGVSRTAPTPNTEKVEYEELEGIRIFLRGVADQVYKIIKDEKTPLFLAGEAEYVSFVKNDTECGPWVKEEMHENLSHMSLKMIGERVMPMVMKNMDDRLNAKLEELRESFGYDLSARGITDVWKATKLGQVRTLIVEETYAVSGHTPVNDDLTLVLGSREKGLTANFHEDVVDDLIEIVTMMGGDVIFAPDGRLAEYQHVAAILRYPV
jgi:hypothetical protein